jgi:Leucine-rich repeat (LRR) protein
LGWFALVAGGLVISVWGLSTKQSSRISKGYVMQSSPAIRKTWRSGVALLASFAISLGYLSGQALPAQADGTTVTINDAGFAACLDDALTVAGSTFDISALNAITTLSCDGRSIANLTGAEHLTGATSLSFANNEIRNVTPLSQLGSLSALDISNNHIADISPLAYLEPSTFAATGQALSWVIELGQATTVPVVGLWGSPATMASSNTEYLTVVAGEATGLVAGGEIPSITFSDESLGVFSGTLTTKIVPGGSTIDVPDAAFAACITDTLGVLSASRLDISAVREITSLNCDSRGIVNLDGIVFLTGATSFSFAHNQIRSVEPLDGMQNSGAINLSGNKISDLSPVDIEFADGLDVTDQTVAWTIGRNVATAVPLKMANNTAISLTSGSPADVTVDGQTVTGVNVGSYPVNFTATDENRSFSGVLTTLVDDGDVTVTDNNFAVCLDEKLGATGSIFASTDLAAITGTLDCSGRGITDLTGAYALTGLTTLNLSNNSLETADLTAIGGLTHLTTLNLASNKLTGVSALAGDTALTTLDVSGNNITDISALHSLALTSLDATGQSLETTVEAATESDLAIKDLDGLAPAFTVPAGVTIDSGKVTAAAGIFSIPFSSGDPAVYSGTLQLNSHIDVEILYPAFATCLATSLDLPASTRVFSNLELATISTLNCPGQGLTKIDGAEYLTGLAFLNVSHNTISDLSPLAGLKYLTSVDLSENQISVLTPLAGKTSVQNLYLGGNQLTSISELSGLTAMYILDVSDNEVDTLTGVAPMTSMKSLKASGNNLTSLAPVKTLTRLTNIDVSDNQLTSVADLGSLPTYRLKTVSISGNQISSISTLSRFTALNQVYAARNKISDLTPLAGASSLLQVDFANNQISSLAGLSGHQVLVGAKLSGNQITSIAGLSDLPSLLTLDIYDNQIADFSPLSGLPALVWANARNQKVSLTAVPQVATELPLKDQAGAVPTLGTLPSGVSVNGALITADAVGAYDVGYSSLYDSGTQTIEISGNLQLTAAYNTFTTTSTPTISGAPKVDSTLTVNPGTWSPSPDFAVQWKADGIDILGATADTYKLTPAEVGKTITVAVVGTKDTYAAVTKVSAQTEAVTVASFVAPAQITVAGSFEVGETLTANAGSWTPSAAVAYQWLRDGDPITDATNQTYVLTAGDAGKAVSVRVTATRDGYQTATPVSGASVVALGTMTGAAPLIVVPGDGQIAIGKTLQLGTGYWSPSPTFALQWYRAGYPIDGATGYTYTVTAADVGKAITVSQTGSATGYASLTKLSSPTAEVPAGTLAAPSSIEVAGTMAVGQALTADPGVWTPEADAVSYQWYRGASVISGATSASYLLTAADQAQVVTVKVTATKAGYVTASLSSASSTQVAAGSFVTAKPVISGSAVFGQTLQASVDPWSPVANLSWQWLRDGVAIEGATGSNYQLVTADIGKAITVSVAGSLAGYANATATSEATGAVAQASLSGSDSVSVAGELAVGKTLTVDSLAWSPTPDSVTYRWLRDGVAISGATGSTYQLTSDDLAKVVRVEVTATRAGFVQVVLTSAAGDPVSANSFTASAPTISGTAVVNGTLTANLGSWSPTPSSVSYQWKADGEAITDATASTYQVGAGDAGKAITVEVTGVKDGYADKTVGSAETSHVAKATFDGPDQATVSGDFVVGQTLTADPGTWLPEYEAVSYQWLRGGALIDGATDATYTLVPADLAKVITVKVSVTKTGYNPVSVRSVAVDPVAAAPFATAVPTITGTGQVGQTLTANPGIWTPTPTVSYQWLRDGVQISQATGSSYQLTTADAGSAITVAVSGSLAGYATTTVASTDAVDVAEGTLTGPSSVGTTGDQVVGATLTADPGTWTPTTDSFTYRWLADGAPIAGATQVSYTLGADDLGKAINVEVTGVKAGYANLALTSTNATKVVEGTIVTEQPTISGQAKDGGVLTAKPGLWSPKPSSWTYQWYRDGDAIANDATGATYTLTGNDVGTSITVKVAASLAGYTTTAAIESDPVEVGTAGSFVAPDEIQVSGEYAVGKTLSADRGTWSPSGATYSYQWLRSGTAIDGATDSDYTLVDADLGTVVTVKVTAAKDGYRSASSRSSATSAVAAGSFQAETPAINGVLALGQTLTASANSWTPNPVLSYQWYRSGVAIVGATNPTYVIVPADAGSSISVRVTGTRTGYAQADRVSAATSAVPMGVLSGSAPTISGKAQVKKTLTAKAKVWTPGPYKITYRWLRNGKVIKGATKSKYKVAKTDRGKKISVKVTVTKVGYTTRAFVSKSSAKVKR